MVFPDLYTFAQNAAGPAVSLLALKNEITAHHNDVGEVNFYPVEIDPDVLLGYMEYERDRTSPYADEFTVANIRYAKSLNRCWRRFVCCKELMHVFDSEAERVNTRTRFLLLMQEFGAAPLRADRSAMLESEINAEWMAVVVLCPRRLRDALKPRYLDKSMSAYEVALSLKIPEGIIGAVMGDYYDIVLQKLTGLQPAAVIAVGR